MLLSRGDLRDIREDGVPQARFNGPTLNKLMNIPIDRRLN